MSLTATRNFGWMASLIPHLTGMEPGTARATRWLGTGRSPIRTGYPQSLTARRRTLSVLLRPPAAGRYIAPHSRRVADRATTAVATAQTSAATAPLFGWSWLV